jgi:hypothetical protein
MPGFLGLKFKENFKAPIHASRTVDALAVGSLLDLFSPMKCIIPIFEDLKERYTVLGKQVTKRCS